MAFALSGCSSTPKIKPAPWTVSITKKTPASIEVDLIGVTKSELDYYQTVSWDDYWKPDSQVRKDAPKISKFLEMGKPWVVALKKDSKHLDYEDRSSTWTEWHNRGVVALLLVARLPESGGFWKRPLSLDEKAWNTEQQLKSERHTIIIEVKDSCVVLLTPSRD